MADYGVSVDLFEAGVTVEPGTANIYGNVRIPAITRTGAGTLIAFAEGRHVAGDDGNIDIIARRSTDGGATWGSTFKVAENGTQTAGNPVPIIAGNGDVVLVYTRQDDLNSNGGGSTRIPLVKRSTDDGVTWGSATNWSSLKPSGWTWFATGPGHGIRTSTGRLICPINGNSASGYHAGCMYSDDDGTTWSLGSYVTANTSTLYNESTIAELPDSSLVMFSRNQSDTTSDPDVIRSVSTDMGATWGAPSNANLVHWKLQGSVVQHRDRLLFSGGDDPSTGVSATRLGMKIRQSTNGGTSWTELTNVWDRLNNYGAGYGMAAYSDMCITGGNSVGLIYERGHEASGERYRYTTFVRVPLDGITQVGSAEHAGNGETADATSTVINKPTGVQQGDLLLLVFTCNSMTVTTLSGWTLYSSTSNGVLFSKIYYKVAGSSEPASYTWSHTSGPRLASLTAWRGVNTASPLGSSPAVSNNAGGSDPMTTPTYSGNDVTDGLMCFVRSAFITSVTPMTFTSNQFVREVFDIDQSPSASNSQRSHCLFVGNHNFEGTAESKSGQPINISDTAETNNTLFTFAINAGNSTETYWENVVTPIPTTANAPRSGIGARASSIG